MKTKQFKTNIMCGSCIAKVTPVLNESLGENNWVVDITDPGKILTVSNEEVNADEVIVALRKVGYKAEGLQ
jgi:copper chaperone CopZ